MKTGEGSVTRAFLAVIIVLGWCSYAVAQNSAQKLVVSYAAESKGDYHGSLTAMRTVLQQDESEPFYQLRIGWLCYCNGRNAEAATYYAKVAKTGKSEEAFEGLVNAEYAQKNWSKVLSVGTQLLTENSQNRRVQMIVAYACMKTEKYKNAIVHYQNVLEHTPYNLDALGYMLHCQRSIGDAVAQKTYRLLKKYSPQNPFVLEYAANQSGKE